MMADEQAAELPFARLMLDLASHEDSIAQQAALAIALLCAQVCSPLESAS